MRRILRSSPAWLIVLCFFGAGPAPARACSCIGPQSACESFWHTDVVFLGRALDVRVAWRVEEAGGSSYLDEHRSILFEVEEVFKGMKETEMVVEVGTGMGGGDCGYDFEAGERYLVFARRDLDDNSLWTGICSTTHPAGVDEDDLLFLRSLPTAPPEGWVFGFVESFWNSGKDHGSTKLGGIEILLEGKEGKYRTTTDEKGNYRLDHLPPGTYKAHVDLPADKESPRTDEFELRAKGCVELFFIYEVEPPRESTSETEDAGEDPED